MAVDLADTVADFLQSVETTETRHRQAFEACETWNRQALAAYRTSCEQSIKDITKVHTKTMDDMRGKVLAAEADDRRRHEAAAQAAEALALVEEHLHHKEVLAAEANNQR